MMRYQSSLKLLSSIKKYPLIITSKQSKQNSKQNNKKRYNNKYHNLSFLNNIKNGVVAVSTCVLIASSNLYFDSENVLAVTRFYYEKITL